MHSVGSGCLVVNVLVARCVNRIEAGGAVRVWKPTERCRVPVELRSIWERKLESALKVVRAAADLWSAKGADAVGVDSLIAVLLHIFSDRWLSFAVPRQIKVEVRSFAAWRLVASSALIGARRLNPKAPIEVARRGVDAIASELRAVAREWSKGDPENPPTEHVLNMIVHGLFESRLGKWPANPKLPTSFRTAQDRNQQA
jgi:hypothetical protein